MKIIWTVYLAALCLGFSIDDLLPTVPFVSQMLIGTVIVIVITYLGIIASYFQEEI